MAAETFEEAVALYTDKDLKTAFQVAKPLPRAAMRVPWRCWAAVSAGPRREKDPKAAIKWLTGAAEKGNSGAQFALAIHYLDERP